MCALLGGSAAAQSQSSGAPQLTVTDDLWSDTGESVELGVQLSGLTQQVELRPYLRGVASGRAEARGTAAVPSSGPQTVSLTIGVPPAQRWKSLSIGVTRLCGDQEARFNMPQPGGPEGGDLYVMAVGVRTLWRPRPQLSHSR